jgi:[protein-PII] uridylyltransferase
LVLCAKTTRHDVEKLAEAILYPLWDAKVDAGHAVRAFDQALSLPADRSGRRDGAARRALHGGRQGAGGQVPGGVPGRVAKTAAEDFVAACAPSRRSVTAASATRSFLLEPDLKNGPGGMRDLCVGRWAAMARFRDDPIQAGCWRRA